ncbi:hypothetical protein LCGC14_0346850 [marine sediment metagenome]|uniref:Uncharacterized protein n=1 Tax=marine sediment metagenome TaxID=412755 RepID=A0A0F9TUZ6_9ZZZZ|nr:hypothetical protein [Maribacter sp.]
MLLLFIASCSDDDNFTTEVITPASGDIAGGPFNFCIDGVLDMVSGIKLNS